MFLDQVIITVESGSGGNGAVAWRREKYEPFGGPAGGDGGRGGSVYLEACKNLQTLIDFQYQTRFFAEKGENGRTKNQHGKAGESITIRVPVGTLIRDTDTQQALVDLMEDGQRVLVAQGGRGGRGNSRFVTSRRQAPYFAEPGEPGIRRRLELELKLIADVGLVGLPNAGKSTLISVISAARPKIADYPFTTLSPNLGVVRKPSGDGLVVADIPGLIEGASQGVGLGHDFLRHVERTRMLLHLVELDPVDGSDPAENYRLINAELAGYSQQLAQKPQQVVLTKADTIPDSLLTELVEHFEAETGQSAWVIASVTRQGIDALLHRLMERVESLPPPAKSLIVPQEDTRATDNDDSAFTVTLREPGWFNIRSGKVSRWVAVTDFANRESIQRLMVVLKGMGVVAELQRQGVRPGDTVQIGKAVFDYEPDDMYHPDDLQAEDLSAEDWEELPEDTLPEPPLLEDEAESVVLAGSAVAQVTQSHEAQETEADSADYRHD